MMVPKTFYSVVITTVAVQFVWTVSDVLGQCTKVLCRNASTVDGIFYGYFAGEPLNNTYMETKYLEKVTVKKETLCVKNCMAASKCFSVNIGPADNEFECQLLGENKYEHSSLLIEKPDWKHISLKSSGCDINKCQNGGTCSPMYKGDSWKCICDLRYAGKYCQTEIYDPTSEFLFTDGVFTNTGSTATPHFTTASNSISKFDYERNSTVLNCLGTTKCVTSATTTPVHDETLCLLTPHLDCKNGFTFMFWFKLVRNQMFELDKEIYILSTGEDYTGITIKFNHGKSWVLEVGIKEELIYRYKFIAFEDHRDFPFRWHHIATTWNIKKSEINVFVDGSEKQVPQKKEIHNFTTAVAPHPVSWLGIDSQFSMYPRFDFDDLKIWIKEKLPEEINYLYTKDLMPNIH